MLVAMLIQLARLNCCDGYWKVFTEEDLYLVVKLDIDTPSPKCYPAAPDETPVRCISLLDR
jgi:hypothetical protein